MEDFIYIKGAKENNLKSIDLKIPRDQFIVLTGLSGSGKSSLAFDTLYAEGQRRYVESLSAYTRQFLGKMKKPACDYIKGLPPAIAIEQKTVSRNPRSTVGTSTEIYDYLRMLFARVGKTYSPISHREVKCHTVEDVKKCVLGYTEGTKLYILSPFPIAEDRTIEEQLRLLQQQGIHRLERDGEVIYVSELLKQDLETFDAQKTNLLIDRFVVNLSKDSVNRLADSIETAFFEGNGQCLIRIHPSGIVHSFSNRFEADGISFIPPSEHLFAFNSPLGACPCCEGLGKVMGIDEDLVIPDPSLSVYDDAVICWRGESMRHFKMEFCKRAERSNFPLFKAYNQLTKEEKQILWYGDAIEKQLPLKERYTIESFFEYVKRQQYKIQFRLLYNRFLGKSTCTVCWGSRLRKEAEYVKINDKSITQLVEMPLADLYHFMENLSLTETEQQIAKRLLEEILNRVDFLLKVGLGYLTLNRLSNSLSGGESQRINLATSLGSPLVGSLYILDEPSIGLHTKDTQKLITVLKKLKEEGNTVIVVEHDEEIMQAADYLIDIGPEAGRNGGMVVFQGELKDLTPQSKSYTLQYLLGERKIEIPQSYRSWTHAIKVVGAYEHNLKQIDVTFPLNVMAVVTGVSGSGKSTLVNNILYLGLKQYFNEVASKPGHFMALEGDLDSIQSVELIDQNPIGKSSRSNPVTYLKAYDDIRKLMAEQPFAKQMEYTPAYFSFNTEGGRCEECKGEGSITVEMQFMADLLLTCEACKGKRFKAETLDVHFQGKSIYDILEMTVNQAIEFFTTFQQPKIAKKLKPLQDVGLGYIKLGQSSSTLSGGESQRVKLAYYLSQEKTKPTLFIFDEPTTGLHTHDIKKLLKSFQALIERGHSLVIIEHNIEVIKSADYVIDIGPEGGDKGGMVVATGTPLEVAQTQGSYTGEYLKKYFDNN